MVISILLGSSPASAADEFLTELAKMDIGSLMSQEVTSVLRKKQPVLKAPSAIFVLTNEDIRRSGARNIPEALRLVPEITVGRVNANTWTIAARGFDSNGSAKLLVLIDGRSVYSPLFSGVFWDVQDLMLEDVERIEVIKGPGAVSWGENAVNGVINIITKTSQDTQGGLIVGGGGKEELGFGSVRYGGKVGEDTTYRAYSKYDLHDSYRLSQGGDAEDEWDMGRAGFRMDSKLSPAGKDSITFQGDIYNGETNNLINRWVLDEPPFTVLQKDQTDLAGGNLLFRWNNQISEESKLAVQTYYDRTERKSQPFSEYRDTFDLDIQHEYKLNESHSLVYGGDIRFTTDELENSRNITFESTSQTDGLQNFFIQDVYSLVPGKLDLIPGIKLGYNDFSGFEYQPSGRFVYTPTKNNAIWGAISRAVRSPARIDENLRISGNPTIGPDGQVSLLSLYGNQDFQGENLMAYELGFRSAITEDLVFSISTYYHKYDDLLSIEPGQAFFENDPLPAHTVIPYSIANNLNGDAYGMGSFINWYATESFELSGAFSYIELDFYNDPDSQDIFSSNVERQTPHSQANLRGHLKLPYDLELDTILYYQDSVPNFQVNSHLRFDSQLGWHVNENLLLNFVVQDLFSSSHHEYGGGARKVETERTFYGKVTYRFN